MRRALTRAEYSPDLEIIDSSGAERLVKVSGIIPMDSPQDFTQAVNLQLAFHEAVAADKLHVSIACCDASVRIAADLNSLEAIKELQSYVTAKNDTLRSIGFRALGSVSLLYYKRNPFPMMDLQWDKRYTDLLPSIANTVVDTHRFDLKATAVDVIHVMWGTLSSYRSFYD